VTDAANSRFSWLAIIFSLIMPGMGQIYCGRLGLGLLITLLFGASTPIIVISLAQNSPVNSGLFALSFLPFALIYIGAMIHAFRAAKSIKPGFILKEYNRWYIYLLLILIGTGSELGYALYAKGMFIQAYKVAQSSMYPTFLSNDRVLTNKIAYKRSSPQKGDIVMISNPENPSVMWIKRVIALEGDTVEIVDSCIYVNSIKLELEPISSADAPTYDKNGPGEYFYETNNDARYMIFLSRIKHGVECMQTMTVPHNHLFLLGDNRNNSLDSRFSNFGHIPLCAVRGRVDYIYYPSENWSRFGRISR